MRMAARELLRRPRSFLVPLAILCMLALLQLYPSAILDGILMDATAAVQNAPAELVVYSSNANGVQIRSRIETPMRDQITKVPGVASVASFDLVPLAGKVGENGAAMGLAVLASDKPLAVPVGADQAVLPAPGEAIADVSLQKWSGLKVNDKLTLGPYATPVTVTAFAPGTNLWFVGGLVVNKATWLAALGYNLDPAAAAAQPTQSLLVSVADGASVADVKQGIATATNGGATAMTRDEAVAAMPGVAEQQQIFGYVRLVSLAVAVVVVALFLSFITLERGPLYAVLKAIGASSGQIYGALVAQILLITVTSVVVAVALTAAMTLIPSRIPPIMAPGQVVYTMVSLAITAVLGTAVSFRRVVRVDPAAAIG
jgi:putative ABC transport system permease protein